MEMPREEKPPFDWRNPLSKLARAALYTLVAVGSYCGTSMVTRALIMSARASEATIRQVNFNIARQDAAALRAYGLSRNELVLQHNLGVCENAKAPAKLWYLSIPEDQRMMRIDDFTADFNNKAGCVNVSQVNDINTRQALQANYTNAVINAAAR